MTGRAYVLPVAIAAAVGLPYFASEKGASSPTQVGQLPSAISSGGLAHRTQQFVAADPSSGAGRNLPGVAGPPGSQPFGQVVSATPWTPATPRPPSAGPGSAHFQPAPSPYGGSTNSPGIANHSLPANLLFRFDITPQWIIQTWPQVSSEVSDPPLSGLRTAVVTGTAMHDIAGSMTYYFDGMQQLQRIMFQGTTGDPAQLVQLLASHYQMTSEPALSGATYVTRDQDRVTNVMQVRHLPLVRQSDPHRRYQVVVELNRPGGTTGLSELQAELLEHERKLLTPRALANPQNTRGTAGASPPTR